MTTKYGGRNNIGPIAKEKEKFGLRKIPLGYLNETDLRKFESISREGQAQILIKKKIAR